MWFSNSLSNTMCPKSTLLFIILFVFQTDNLSLKALAEAIPDEAVPPSQTEVLEAYRSLGVNPDDEDAKAIVARFLTLKICHS